MMRAARLVVGGCLLLLALAGQAQGANGAWSTALADRPFTKILVDGTGKVAYAAGNTADYTPYVYKSSDQGATWAPANTGVGTMAVYALGSSRASPNTVFIGGYNPGPRTLALYVTNDGGVSWHQLGIGMGDYSVQAIAVDPVNPSNVYLGTNRGVFKSSDGGNSFNLLPGMAARNTYTLAMDTSNPPVLWAGTAVGSDPGVWKSADGGASWQLVAGGLPGGGVFVVAVDPGRPSTVYAAVNATPYAVARSTDFGLSWTTIYNPDPVYSMAVDPLNANNLWLSTTTGLYRGVGGAPLVKIGPQGNAPLALDQLNPQTIYVGGAGVATYTGNLASVGPAPAPPACTPQATPAGSGASATFPTGHTVSGIWLDFLRTHGDVDILGYPRTEVICDPQTGQTVQYFQRVVLEYHGENQPPYQVQRRLLVDQIYPGPPDAPADPAAPPRGPFTFYAAPKGFGHYVANSAPDGTPIYFKDFFDSHGREDIFGYPREEPKQRPGPDGVTRWTQRFQAAVFEYHPENDVEGKRNWRVQLELLGDEYIAKLNLGYK